MSLTKVSYSMINGAVVNILDYGAIGDGTTDDTAAYLAAIATGKSVYFPSGTYLVCPVTGGGQRTSSAVLSSNQTLFGNGASSIIKWKDSFTGQSLLMATNASNIVIRDLKFTAGPTQQPLALQITPASANSVSNVTIQNCYFTNLGIALGLGDQLETNNSSFACSNITVRDCIFDTIYVHAVLLSNINGFIVDNCYFENVGYVSTGGYCVDMSQGSRYGTLSNCIGTDSRYFSKVESSTPVGGTASVCLSHNISILNNNIYDMAPVGAANTEFAIGVINGVSDIIINGNTIVYSNTAIFCSDTNPAATGPLFIENNTCNSADSVLLFMNNASLNIPANVNNNVLTSTDNGVYVAHTSFSIKDNFITAGTGVQLVSTSSFGLISGNSINGTSYGILFNASTTSDVEIIANKIQSTSNFLYLNGTLSKITVLSNKFKATTTGGYVNSVNSFMYSNNYVQDVSTSGVPSLNMTNISNALIGENTFNTNTGNASTSLTVSGTLLNVLAINNISSRTVSIAAGTNVTSTNNAFAIAYTA